MKAFIAVTDGDWFRYLRSRQDLDEVNFWQPGGNRLFKVLSLGEPLLFKLHAPDNFIAGGGFFAHASLLPVTRAWEAFEDKNGATSLLEMRHRVERYRRAAPDPHEDYTVGCIILRDPFFFDRADWLPVPSDFHPQTVQGKSYDLRAEPGRLGCGAAPTQRASERAKTRPTAIRASSVPAWDRAPSEFSSPMSIGDAAP